MELGTIIFLVMIYIILFSSFFSLILFFQKRKEIFIDKEVSDFPKVTIVVPAYQGDTAQGIALAVNSSLNLDYPKKETIISWNGPKSGLFEEIKKYESLGVKIIFTEEKGKASGLNNALKEIDSEFFCCLDGDSSFEPYALKPMLGYFEDPKVGAVTSAMKISEPKTMIEKLQWMEYIFSILLRRILSLINCLTVVPGPGSMYRTSTVIEIGGFKSKILAEDMEIAFRMHSHGYKVASAINCIVYTIPPEKFKGLLNQRVRWYGGFCENIWTYKNMFLNPKHKLLGMYILPSAFIWIAILFYSLYKLGAAFFDGAKNIFLNIYLTGFNLNLWLSNWRDFFYFEANYTTVFGILLFGLAIVTILLSLKVSKEELNFKKRYVNYTLYLVIYSPMLGIFWLSTAIYLIFRSRLTEWIKW